MTSIQGNPNDLSNQAVGPIRTNSPLHNGEQQFDDQAANAMQQERQSITDIPASTGSASGIKDMLYHHRYHIAGVAVLYWLWSRNKKA
jgi:hypothetical protein